MGVLFRINLYSALKTHPERSNFSHVNDFYISLFSTRNDLKVDLKVRSEITTINFVQFFLKFYLLEEK